MEYKDIEAAYQDYFSRYQVNNTRGRDSIQFVNEGEQWDPGAAGQRVIANKETLVFNSTLKLVNRVKSQNRQIDFVIDVFNKNEDDGAKYEAMDLLVKHWFNDKNIQEKLDSAWDKLIDYGYAVAEVNYGYANKDTLNLEPIVEVYEDPSEAFFDIKSLLKSRIDGNFCGRKRKLKGSSLITKYPELFANDTIKKDENVVTDFWERKCGKAWYVKMKTGVWFRQDLLSDDDYQNNVARKIDGTLCRKRGTKDDIYYSRYINSFCVINCRPYPTEDLPLVYHAGLTYWTKNGIRTAPYAWFLQSPQRFINLVKSQLATNLKNSTSAKFLGSNSHVGNDKQEEVLRDINSREGFIALADDPQKIMYLPPTEIPQTMIALSQATGTELDMVAGSMTDSQMSDNAVISGVAIKEITNNIQMANAGLISENIRFIDSICRLYVQMLPKIIVEERDFFVKDDNGQMVKVGVNIRTDTGLIKNDISDIRNDFLFDVRAGATTAMEKEVTIKSLLASYQVNPQMFNATADIFYKNMDTPYAMELARRALAFVDPNIIKLGSGEITQEQFYQMQQQKQVQMMQAAQQQQGANPAEQVAAQAEAAKAAAAQQNADTNSQKLDMQMQNQQTQNQLDAAKLSHEIGSSEVQQNLDAINSQLEAEQKIIDMQRMQNEESNQNAG